MSALTNFVEKLNATATDFSTLTVTTVTGDLNVAIQANDDNKGQLDWDKIMQTAMENGVDGNLIVAAVDSYKIDGDALIYRTNSKKLTEEMRKELNEVHQAAIESGRTLRSGIIDLFTDGLKNLVGK
jgi:sugar phosphate isomerase/epimerase